MESMLTGDSFSGVEAAQLGWANRAVPRRAELEENVLAIASRIAQIPSDLVQINKRTVHRAMEVMGLRSSIRAGTELSALATHTESMKKFVAGHPGAAGSPTRARPSATRPSATTAPPKAATTTREHAEDLAFARVNRGVGKGSGRRVRCRRRIDVLPRAAGAVSSAADGSTNPFAPTDTFCTKTGRRADQGPHQGGADPVAAREVRAARVLAPGRAT